MAEPDRWPRRHLGEHDRGPHPTDRRATLLTLTEQGKTLVASWHAERDEGAVHLFAGTSGTELNTFVTVLDRVLKSLRGPEPSNESTARRT